MKRLLLAICLLFTLATSAQTNNLLRKSIGGDVELPEPAGADFGLPSWYYYTKLDTVTRVSPSEATLSFSRYRRHREEDTGTFYQRRVETISLDPTLKGPQSLQDVKKYLEGRYPKQEISNIIFIGFDDQKPLAKKQRAHGKQKIASPKPASPAGGVLSEHRADATDDHAPLFAGGTALFALALCAGIVSLYRKAGNGA